VLLCLGTRRQLGAVCSQLGHGKTPCSFILLVICRNHSRSRDLTPAALADRTCARQCGSARGAEEPVCAAAARRREARHGRFPGEHARTARGLARSRRRALVPRTLLCLGFHLHAGLMRSWAKLARPWHQVALLCDLRCASQASRPSPLGCANAGGRDEPASSTRAGSGQRHRHGGLPRGSASAGSHAGEPASCTCIDRAANRCTCTSTVMFAQASVPPYKCGVCRVQIETCVWRHYNVSCRSLMPSVLFVTKIVHSQNIGGPLAHQHLRGKQARH